MLQPLIEEGNCIVDTSFEQAFEDDWKNPKVFNNWIDTLDELRDINFFDNIGTFVVDTASALADNCMNECISAGGRTGQRPVWNDYFELAARMSQALGAICSLPCNTIVTGHVYKSLDEHRGTVQRMFLAPGKASIKIPAIFDEKYASIRQDGGFWLLTEPAEDYHCCTRIGGHVFDELEEAKHMPNV